jgi:hypothetical protein
MCAKPWRPNGGSELPCGQCMPCRINKRNIWTTRLLLEQTQHEATTWLTLTYNDRYLPYNEELNKDDYQLWLKRVRKAYPAQKIRYYLCGEYGDNSGRPHYHIVLFGIGINFVGLGEFDTVSKLDNGEYRYPNRVRTSNQDVIKMLELWGKGNIHFEKPNPKLMSYTCSHITKSLADIETSEEGRKPAFHAMSQGLGRDAMRVIASWLESEEGIDHYRETGDVPTVVRIDGKLRPIGKYLRNIIRRNLHLPEKGSDEAIYKRGIKELALSQELGKHWKEPQRERDRLKANKVLKFNKQRRGL